MNDATKVEGNESGYVATRGAIERRMLNTLFRHHPPTDTIRLENNVRFAGLENHSYWNRFTKKIELDILDLFQILDALDQLMESSNNLNGFERPNWDEVTNEDLKDSDYFSDENNRMYHLSLLHGEIAYHSRVMIDGFSEEACKQFMNVRFLSIYKRMKEAGAAIEESVEKGGAK